MRFLVHFACNDVNLRKPLANLFKFMHLWRHRSKLFSNSCITAFTRFLLIRNMSSAVIDTYIKINRPTERSFIGRSINSVLHHPLREKFSTMLVNYHFNHDFSILYICEIIDSFMFNNKKQEITQSVCFLVQYNNTSVTQKIPINNNLKIRNLCKVVILHWPLADFIIITQFFFTILCLSKFFVFFRSI